MSVPGVRKAICAGVICLALTAAGCGGGGDHATAAPRHDRSPLISMFEAQPQLLAHPTRTLGQLRRLGVNMIRVFLTWRSIAPEPASHTPPAGFRAGDPAAYSAAAWAPFDRVIAAAQSLDVKVYLTLEGPGPTWAEGPGFTAGGAPGVWRPSATAYGSFVQAVGTRYSGHYTPPGASSPLPRIRFWSIWNEPNLGQADLAPQTTDNSRLEASAVMYRQLLEAGWNALHQTGHGSDSILIGELAPLGQTIPANMFPGTFGEMVPLRFLRALYCVDSSLRPLRGTAARSRNCPTTAAGTGTFARENPALFDATGVAVHPYSGPTRIPPTALFGADFANLANLPKLERMLATITAEYGHPRQYGLWNTEYGYVTDPPSSAGAPLAMAAAFENQAEYMSWRDPWMRSWDHYQLLDPPDQGSSHFFTGLESDTGVPKPTYQAYRMPIYLPATSTTRGHALEVWGCVRPVNHAVSPPAAEIQLQPGGRGAFKTIRSVTLTTGNCYFEVPVSFASGGKVRIAWSDRSGPTIYSRTVAISVG